MKFIEVMMTAFENGIGYKLGPPILINSSHISSVRLSETNLLTSEEYKKELESHFDMELSKLCIVEITLLNQESHRIYVPYEKFKNFNKK